MSPYDENWLGDEPERDRLVRRALGWDRLTKEIPPKHAMSQIAERIVHPEILLALKS